MKGYSHSLSCVQPFAVWWTVAHQAPLSMTFSRQEHWSGLPFPSPGDPPNGGIELASLVPPALQADSWPMSHLGSPLVWKCSVVSDSLQPHGLYSPWNSPEQNTGVGSLFLFQGIFPTQGSNPGLLHCRQIFTSWATREVPYQGIKS